MGAAFVGLVCFFFLFLGPSPTRYGRVSAFAFVVVFGDVGFYFFIAWGKFLLVYVGGQRLPLRIIGFGRGM